MSLRVVYMDATEPFPLPSQSFDAVHCEHVIEHVAYEAGMTMLRECRRVLRPGGVLRIAEMGRQHAQQLAGAAHDGC